MTDSIIHEVGAIREQHAASFHFDLDRIFCRLQISMKSARAAFIASMLAVLMEGSFAATAFTDWTSVDTTAETAQGTLATVGVTLTGTDLSFAVTNGTSTIFSSSLFTPSLPTSDLIEVVSYAPGSSSSGSYAISFSQAVTDPVLHIGSLASVLSFSGINPVRISGDSNFLVSANTVSGLIGTNDSNGTVRLPGTFDSITFSASFVGFFADSRDGIAIQVGMEAPIPSVPEPSSAALFGSGAALGIAIFRLRRRRK